MLLMRIFFRSVINNSTVFAVAGTRQVPCFVRVLSRGGKIRFIYSDDVKRLFMANVFSFLCRASE